jgi:hypothetical protein
MLRKKKKIRDDLSESMLNFINITISLRANFQLPPWKASDPYAYVQWTCIEFMQSQIFAVMYST